MAGIIAPKIVTDGMILYLDAANTKSYVSGSTTWNDLSSMNNNGTLVNGPTFSSLNKGNIVFDGINDYFTFNEITFTDVSYTIEIVGKISGVISTSNRKTIFNNGSLVGEFSDNNTYFMNIITDSISRNINFDFLAIGSIIPDEIFHWSFSFNYSTKIVTIFFNGLFLTNSQLITYSTFSTSFTKFGSNGSSRYYSGSLYNAKLYNRVLTNEEILQNYNTTKSRYI